MAEEKPNTDGEKLTQIQTATSDDNDDEITPEKTMDWAPIRTTTRRNPALERTQSEVFEQIPHEERAQLKRLATFQRTKTSKSGGTDLERKDTLAGLSEDDPRLDPDSPQFDLYVWARSFIKGLEDEGISRTKSSFTFKNLSVSGSGSALAVQKNVGSVLMTPFRLGETFSFGKQPKKPILRDFNGCVQAGEMLVVLGRPGSGCSTFLKTMCGELAGLNLEDGTDVHYNGIPQERLIKEYKGECIYNQEVDKHFPHLTVGETLEFAAAARAPQKRPKGLTRAQYIKDMTAVVMAIFGLSHTKNTKVGNDFVRGVSGGERKRVSISEMALAGSPLAAWDNSTRGLDAATALEFCRTLRLISDLADGVNAVAIYQASQAIYDLFDKAIVLYEGRQIYFGPASEARAYFEEMGWYCPPRQTTGDFLTSVTNPQERKPKDGFEKKVPRTADEFASYWQKSSNCKRSQEEIEEHEAFLGEDPENQFEKRHAAMQVKGIGKKSPYVISIPMMIRLCGKRSYQRIMNDKTSTISVIFSQIVMALIVGSIFYGTPATTSAFFAKGSVLFFAVLLNALISIGEINALYEQRAIVEKHASYAFYYPWTEAMAGVATDIPVKFMIAVAFNIILYFLAGLKVSASAFFVFFLFCFIATLTMSSIFRFLAAITSTVSQAMAFAGVMVLAIVIYTGFTLPRPYAHPWMKWISWINPVAYAFEAILVNEVHGSNYACANLVPAPPIQVGDSFVCGVAGARPGERSVSGDSWVQSSYQYSYSHIWRNLGFLFAFQIFFLFIYLLATQLNASSASTAEFLIFRRGHAPSNLVSESKGKDEEAVGQAASSDSDEGAAGEKVNAIPPQKDIFTWRDVVYDISIKGEPRRLLDHVSGWVKPGTLTALMGVSGAGKTTLLDALAQRTSTGVITGDMLVNGKPLDPAFQRKTGYVQQQDLHLETTTVREALRFSAALRQPKSVPKSEKYAFVEEVIDMLAMRDFAEAVVGVPGEGLNVEQRKLLTIGVELAAKPALLLFLDEPTSGLDSQSSWAIIAFLRKLADRGQAVLSTIHQPSAILFQEFDRLLFLARGGKTCYFGDVGPNSRTLLDYFEANGARQCGESENPAEYMLEMVGAGATGKSAQDWPTVWKDSQESKAVQAELDRIHEEKKGEEIAGGDNKEAHQEFAMPFYAQLQEVTIRVFQQYWRTPSYVYGKILLGVMSAIFIGFSFYKQNASQQGLQNQIFSIFMLTAILSTLVQQIMPRFVSQRALYEVRERPSKAYSWAAFIIANIFVEIPYQILMGILVFASYYYPTFGKHQASERQGLILLICIQFFIFASTFAHLVIAALPDAETAGNVVTLLFSLSLTFNGVLQPPTALPGFWIFMYRVSPLTYIVSSLASAGISGRTVECASNEIARFPAPDGISCGRYLSEYAMAAGGQVLNPESTTECQYCPLSNSDQFLATVAISYDQRWRNFGIVWAYIGINIMGAVLFYWAFRVRRWSPNTIKKWPGLLAHYFVQAGRYLRIGLVRHDRDLARVGTKEHGWGKKNKIF